MCQLHCDDCPLLCFWPVAKRRECDLVCLTMEKIFEIYDLTPTSA